MFSRLWILVLMSRQMVQCLNLILLKNNADLENSSNGTHESNRNISASLNRETLNGPLIKLIKMTKLDTKYPKLRSIRDDQDFSFIKYDDAPRNFCGETLVYAVEYYCVHIIGTSVYQPGNDADDYDFISRKVKDKRENGEDDYRDQIRGKLL